MAVGQRGLQELWLKALLFVLFGYALLDKGFAYLFLGEIVLFFGAVVFLKSRRVMLVFSDPVLLLWGLFAFWGLCRTVPFLSMYRFDAIRDSVIWAYGMVALMIVAFVNRSSQISRALSTYRKFLRWYLPVIPILLILSLTLGRHLPRIPWASSTGILTIKAGDVAVSASTAAIFLLTFPNPIRGEGRHVISINRSIGFFGLFLTTAIILPTSRGGFLSLVLPVLLFAVQRAREVIWKIAAMGIFGAALALALFMLLPENAQIGNKSISADKVLATVASIGGGEAAGTAHSGTAQWRLIWWTTIVRETFFGPYFWTGRGFGVNLAVADGPFGNAMSEEEVALRSPHNGSMSILARMGVPGLLIWIALNIAFVVRMLKAQRLAARSGSRFWSGLNLWILASWLAAITNLSFDVYLEGPQGGIWFWAIIGFGVAALRIQAHEVRQPQFLSRIEDQAPASAEYAADQPFQASASSISHPICNLPIRLQPQHLSQLGPTTYS